MIFHRCHLKICPLRTQEPHINYSSIMRLMPVACEVSTTHVFLRPLRILEFSIFTVPLKILRILKQNALVCLLHALNLRHSKDATNSYFNYV